jgi:tRNA threonylcarbamoyladenosine biosynthesis protein TsaE
MNPTRPFLQSNSIFRQMTSHLTFLSDSEESTDEFASTCAGAITEGITLALNGELGSGKTRFVRAFCEGLGIDSSDVTSPTFVLMQLYRGPNWTVSHFDTYRLGDPDEFLALGAEEYLLDPDHICVIEWANRVAEILPPDHLSVEIRQTGATQRQFELSAAGPRSDALLARIRQNP